MQKLLSKPINPFLLEYQTTTKIDSFEYNRLEKLLLSVDGVANIVQRDRYCLTIHVGELFNPVQIKENIFHLIISNKNGN